MKEEINFSARACFILENTLVLSGEIMVSTCNIVSSHGSPDVHGGPHLEPSLLISMAACPGL